MIIVRSVFALIDRGIYSMISGMYDIIMYLADFSFFKGTDDFTTRIYTLLGIFMLFKISFSFISYIINPDSFFDKTKGFQKIIVNILITFVLLIMTPWIFYMLTQAQSAILEDNILPNFFLGTTERTAMKTEFAISEHCYDKKVNQKREIGNVGDYISLMTFSPFYQIDEGYFTENGSYSSEKAAEVLVDNLPEVCMAGNVNDLLINDYFNAKGKAEVEDEDIKGYYFDYNIILSSVVGAVVLLILISFAFDIATRTVKLFFLELTAPIFIISYIEPDPSKQGMFKNWIKSVTSTWLSLFVRLSALFLGIYMIVNIDIGERPDGVGFFAWQLIKMFIIVGILIFTKQLPSLLEELIPGLKLGNGLELNPFKKISKDAIGGNLLMGAADRTKGLALGAVGGGIAGAIAGREVGNAKKGIAMGMLNGASGGIKKPKGAFGNSMNQSYKTLTGNEMKRFSPVKMFAQAGGERAISEVKSTIGALNSEYRSATQRLSVQNRIVEDAGAQLQQRNINLADIPTARTNIIRHNEILTQTSSNAQSRITEAQSNIEKGKRELTNLQSRFNEKSDRYNNAQEFINNYKPSMVDSSGNPIYSQQYRECQQVVQSFEAEKSALTVEISNKQAEVTAAREVLNNSQSEYQNAQQQLNVNADTLNHIDSYEAATHEALVTREQLTEIEKNLSVMKGEKSQRETFYQVDSSPSSKVNEIMDTYNNNNNN